MDKKQRMTYKIPFILMFVVFIFSGCEKRTEWELLTEELNTIVVEAIITNELKTQQIILSYPVGEMSQNPASASGAVIRISYFPYEIVFYESENNPGVYLSEVPFRAMTKMTYELKIEYGPDLYTAEAYMEKAYPFSPPDFHYDSIRGMYRLYRDLHQYNPFEQSMLEVIVSWDHLPGYAHPDSLAEAKMLFYSFKTIDVSYIVSPQDREVVYFPRGSVVVFSKYSLNDEYASYLRGLLIESQYQGSLFEGARANPKGNVSNGGLGFFAACEVLRDTVVVGY